MDLRWDPVPSAKAYRVLSDGRVVGDNVSRDQLSGSPGQRHRHPSVRRRRIRRREALLTTERRRRVRGDGTVGAVGLGCRQPSRGSSRPIPRRRARRARPARPSTPQKDKHANGIVTCDYPNGVYVEVLRYADNTARGARQDEVRKAADTPTTWTTTGGGAGGNLYLGADGADPWRWWTFNERPGYAMYASWPKHTADELKKWWVDAPF